MIRYGKTIIVYSLIFLLIIPPFSYAEQSESTESYEVVDPLDNELIQDEEESQEYEDSNLNNKESSQDANQDLNENEDESEDIHKIKEVQENEANNNDKQNNNDEDSIENFKVKNQAKDSDPYTEGYRSKDVVELKRKLIKLGFGGMNLNELYGSFTVTRVKQLQEYYNIQPANGVANKATRDLIDQILSTPLQEGKKHPSVIPLKEKLISLGYGGMNLNEHYGSFTATRVKQFQRDNNIKQNGIIDPVTQTKLDSYYPSILREGVRSPLVIDLKEKLVTLGFGGMNLNEHYGSFTAKRVKQLQEYYLIKPVDGIVGDQTSKSIDNILSNSFNVGDKDKKVIDIKKKLIDLGYGGMNLNEHYGSFTATRMKQFQRDNGLKQNGLFDPITENKLDSYYPAKLEQGIRSPLVVDLKKQLIELGFGGMNINEHYGSFTAKKVKQLQEYYSIKPADGVTDQNTLDTIDHILETSIKLDDRNKTVIDIKHSLIALGYGGMNINEHYGPFTAKRIKQLQKDNGLIVNGIVDPVTMELLNSEINIYYEGNRHPLIIEFKEKLIFAGFGNMNINDHYGSFTTTRVKQFQRYFNLEITGTGTKETIDKLDELYNTNLQEGKKHSSVIPFKEDLIKLGFGNMNLNETYGSFTRTRVVQFQEHFGLIVNGIGDDRTIQKIDEILSTHFQVGHKHKDVIQLKKDLKKIGYGGMNINETYGSYTAQKVREFQRDYNLPQSGIADEITLAKIAELIKAMNYTNYNISLEDALDMQMNSTPQTDKREYAWVAKSYIDENNRVTASALNVRTQPTTANTTENRILGTLPKHSKVDIIDEKGNWFAIKYQSTGYNWYHATREDTLYYLDPDNFRNDEIQRFQFLDLSKLSGAPRSVLNNYLRGKGVLSGQGQAFIDAGRVQGINEIYLISHSILETGNGASTLASGVEVGINSSDKPVRVTEDNRDSLNNIKKVYNVYGIGAYDSCPVDCGAARAYEEGWDTVAKAIKGGASFIGTSYLKAGQNTLYKMRWNPKAMEDLGYATHQYATDIGWASKQVYTMYNIYMEMDFNVLYLDIPVYK